MRLKSIKLAGFKSFVDPTTLNLPTNLTCVVGPNGCGKSNTIDAVRWVMGESNAKHLRGESLADVIFNGSSTRKPVGKASIELVFDNSAGKLGGQYGAFAEISVRREVTREGQSNYYLNGARCRRRDITDLFLGTGLGPRSYAIIEQGMISRFIEAKPDELRVFIEEAAGISKYKERRRETENRMRHTNENLERLQDLRDEVEAQLKKLKRQAEVAERYKGFQTEKRQVELELAALRWNELEGAATGGEIEVAELAGGLSDAEVGLRTMVGKLDQTRTEQQSAQDLFNDVQGRYYAVGADVARLEQNLKHSKELRERQKTELASLHSQRSNLQSQLAMDEASLQQCRQQLEVLTVTAEEANEQSEIGQERLDAAEESEQAGQQQWDECNAQASKAQREADVERTKLENLEDRLRRSRERAQKINDDLRRQELSPLLQQLEEMSQQFDEAETLASEHAENAESGRVAVATLREQEGQLQSQLHQQRGEMQQLGGRITSLETLRQAALRDTSKAVGKWLREQGLESQPTVGEQISVEKGWELAVESVLGSWLQVRSVSELGEHSAALSGAPDGRLQLLQSANTAPVDKQPSDSLVSKVSGLEGLQPWLANVRCIESSEQAMQRRGELSAVESFVTPDGFRIGPNWLETPTGHAKGDSKSAGGSVLERERELRELQSRREALQEVLAQSEEQLAELREKNSQAAADAKSAEQQQRDSQRGLQEVRGQLDRLKARQEQMEQRREQLQEELLGLNEQNEDDQVEEKASRGRMELAVEQLQSASQLRAEMELTRGQGREQLQQARSEVRDLRNKAGQLNASLEAQRATERSLSSNVLRQEGQLSGFGGREEELMMAVEAAEEPLAEMQEQLEEKVSERLVVDESLSEARDALAGFESKLKEFEQQRAQFEAQSRDFREKLEQARLQLQELRVRQQGFVDQLLEQTYTPQGVLKNLATSMADADEHSEPASAKAWQQRLDQLEERIRRLGTVNLAAIEEYEATAERQNYLDAQHADLAEALETLTSAINKIDRETRSRFSETFNLINEHMKQMFPRLFGGGAAWLEMTGDDVLDTGVTIMARPPGKRNSTIHLLSGGEKALTAVAMVFSIFQLNPAPFCMLDEVDAPLDDANVGRFSRLVEEMSEHLQFVYISHNKVAMEMANSLLGVTMQEPGVSRLVSVDVEEAVQMVAA